MSFNDCSNVIGLLNPSLSVSNTFFEFVYGKISRDTKNRFVEKGEDYIDILPFDTKGVRVIPVWKDINISKLDIKDELDKASTIIKDGEINQVYLVYPKNEKFTKHIEIRNTDLDSSALEYKIKVIPYSLNSLVRKGKNDARKCC